MRDPVDFPPTGHFIPSLRHTTYGQEECLKLVTYEHNGVEGFGALAPDGIIGLTGKYASIHHLLEAGPEELQQLARVLPTIQNRVSESAVRLLPPVPRPKKLLCLAGNYSEHILEGGGEFPGKEKMTPRVFMKPPTTTLIGSGDAISLPQNAQQIDWECELAVVIGKHARFVDAADGLDYVAGYTVLLDISERKLLIDDGRQPRDGDRWFDWLNGKWFDTFAPCGPCLVTKDDIPDPQVLPISLSVNGEIRQSGNTGQMIFSVAELVAWASTLMTLEPGDIIATGTLSGVGAATGQFLKSGDRVEGEIEGIGSIVCPVTAQA